MNHSDPDGCGIFTLLKYVSEDRKAEFREYVDELIREHSAEIDHTFLGFISDYVHYAQLIERKASIYRETTKFTKATTYTVYDIGCAFALQHLVFPDYIHYVGVDMDPKLHPKFFRPNCSFIRGRASEVLPTLQDGSHTCIGIANMSLSYGPLKELYAFDTHFKMKFVF